MRRAPARLQRILLAAKPALALGRVDAGLRIVPAPGDMVDAPVLRDVALDGAAVRGLLESDLPALLAEGPGRFTGECPDPFALAARRCLVCNVVGTVLHKGPGPPLRHQVTVDVLALQGPANGNEPAIIVFLRTGAGDLPGAQANQSCDGRISGPDDLAALANTALPGLWRVHTV